MKGDFKRTMKDGTAGPAVLLSASILYYLLSVPCGSFAAFNADSIGTSSAQFLKLGAGARASGMGEAYSAVGGEADAVYWNPAALSGIRAYSGLFMHADLFTEFNYEYLGYAQPLKNLGGIGLGVQYLSAGKIAETDSSGFGTGSSMNPSHTAITLAYGRKLDVFGVGASAKYVRSKLAGPASAFAVDVGALSPGFFADQIRLAFVIRNIGSGLKYDRKTDPLPLSLRIGGRLNFLENLTLGVDLDSPRDNRPYAALGGEYLVEYPDFSVAGRLGYNTRTSGGLAGFSAGLGAVLGDFSFDYAFAPFGELGAAHRMSAAFRFAALPARPEWKTAESDSGPLDALVSDPGPYEFMPEIRGIRISSDAYKNTLIHAQILAERRNYSGAAADCRAAMAQLQPGDPRRVYLLERQGWLALNAGNMSAAKQLYINAIRAARKLKFTGRAVINAYSGLAFCMERAGDFLAAELNYNHALELAPGPKFTQAIEQALRRVRALDAK